MKKIYLGIIELIGGCNLKCKHCYGFFDNKNIISIDDFELACINLSSIGAIYLTVTGGEPLLLGKNIGRYINIAKKHFKRISLTTNGTLLKDEHIKYLENIHVQISLDGTERIHDYIRGKGNYNKAIESLLMLKHNNIECSVMMTISNFNINELEKVYIKTKSIGIPMGIERISNVGRGESFDSISTRNVEKLANFVIKNRIHTSDPLCIVADYNRMNYLMKKKISGGCSAGKFVIVIDSKLNVLPCVRLRIELGNIKSDSIINIINNSELLKDIGNREKLLGKCGICEYKYVCGGCRASGFSINKNIFESDPGCFINSSKIGS